MTAWRFCPWAILVHVIRRRWGINQLDGRKVIAYPPGTIIPNPRPRRLDRALRMVRAEEGRGRCELATLAADAPRRQRVERICATRSNAATNSRRAARPSETGSPSKTPSLPASSSIVAVNSRP
jgi:hypothetical protein